jgi:hypothetical protein
MGRLADDLRISGRTIKRRLDEHPELADALRARKCRGEWRFDYPMADSEYRTYLSVAKAALDRVTGGRLSRYQRRLDGEIQEYFVEHGYPYTNEDRAAFVEAGETAKDPDSRLRAEQHLQWFDKRRQWFERYARRELECDEAAHRRTLERIGADFDHYLGYGDTQREQDIARLKLALHHNRARMERNEKGGWDDTDFEQWQADVEQIPCTARQIASYFKCPVSQAIKHWRDYLEHRNEINRRHNDQEIAELRRLGSLAPNVERLLREADVSQKACDLCVCGEFTRRHVQLWQVKTPAQVSAECERIEQLWPEPEDWPAPKDWDKAVREIRRVWETTTLHEAALELVRDNQPVTTDNLRRLLFRDEEHEMGYKNHCFRREDEKRLAGLPHVWLGQDHFDRPVGYAARPFERANAFYGERGISRREFRQRYTRRDVKVADAAARAAVAVDVNQGSKPEDSQTVPDPGSLTSMVRLDQHGKPILSKEDRQKQQDGFVGGAAAVRVRREFREDKELGALLAGGRARERAEVENALGVSLGEYLKKPFAEIDAKRVQG